MDQHTLACEKHGRQFEGIEGTSIGGGPEDDVW